MAGKALGSSRLLRIVGHHGAPRGTTGHHGAPRGTMGHHGANRAPRGEPGTPGTTGHETWNVCNGR